MNNRPDRPGDPNPHGPKLIPSIRRSQSIPAVRGEDTRWIYRPDPQGWHDFALSEWTLTRAGYSDRHIHSETNVVIEGELHVECNGTVVIAGVGDTVTVPAHTLGKYWAPKYARMIAIYGANPEGTRPEDVHYWDV